MEQLERIAKMEDALDASELAIAEFRKAFEQLKDTLPKFKALAEYYGSEDWFQDCEDSNALVEKHSIKCGVLSEDLAYDVIGDAYAIAIEMLEMGTDIIKSM